MGWSPHVIQAQSTDSLKVTQLEEVTISSIRASSDAPVAQVTVGLKEIQQNFTGQDGAFLLERLSPSLVTYSESGTGFSNYGQMRLRGIDQTRINITLNGVPLNDMIDQGVFFSNFTDFGNSIQSVQVQRGVGTSSNGVASYGGSVNFESISLFEESPSAELQFTGGSFNTVRASAEVHTGLMENRTAFYAKVSRLQSDGYRRHSGTEANSIFLSGGYFGEEHAIKFTGFVGSTQNDLAYSPTPLSIIEQDPRANLLSNNDIDDFGQWLFQAQHTWRLSSNSSLVNTLYYGGAGGDFPFSYSDTSSAIGLSTINYPLHNDHYGFMSNYNLDTEIGNFNLGLHLYTFQRLNEELVEPSINQPYYTDTSTKDEVSLFAKWEKKWGAFKVFADVQARSVYLNLGGDAAYLGELPAIPAREYFFLNPKLGFTYDLEDNWQLYASLGRSGREPTRTDILGSLQINSFNIADVRNVDNVKAEYVNDLEFGSRWQNDKLKLDLNLYLMSFENEIAPIGVYIPEGFYQVYMNQAPSYRSGVELMAHYQISSSVNLTSQISYLHARISSYQPAGLDVVYEDIHPILSPEWNANLSLNYQVSNAIRVGLRGRYLSEQFMELSNDPNLVVPSSFILDLNAAWKFYKQHELSLMVNNLTNELYYTYGAPDPWSGEPAFLVQAPINVYATLRLRF